MNGELHLGLDKSDFLPLFPLKKDRRVRLAGTVSEEAFRQRKEQTWDDINSAGSNGCPSRSRMSTGFLPTTFTIVWQNVSKRQSVLAIGAAHIHSPIVGQGMNTGIGERSILLGNWLPLFRNALTPRLDSHEPERIAFARRLVQTTDKLSRL